MLGSNHEFGRVFGDYGPLPDRYQAAFRHKVRFFELRFPRPSENSQVIFGPFDIKVTEELIPGNREVQFNTIEYVGAQAKVQFDVVDDRGTAIAFLYDDRYWHNRIYMEDNQWMLDSLYAMHTRDGVYPGSEVRQWILALREVVKSPRQIWRVVNAAGREYTFGWRREDAERELTPNRRDNGWHIVEGTKYDWTPDVKQMITKFSRLEFGWTSCNEFAERIVPRVNAIIEQKRKEFVPAGAPGVSPTDVQRLVEQSLQNMPLDKIENILAKARAKREAAEGAPAENEQSYADGFSKSGLMLKTVEQLREIGVQMAVPGVTRKTKEALVDAILAQQAGVEAPADTEPAQEQEEMIIR